MIDTRPTVILHIGLDGDFDLHALGDVRVLWVCDGTPDDRVYEQTKRVSPEFITALMGDSPIGQSGDGVMTPNKEQAILAKLRPGLTVVQS